MEPLRHTIYHKPGSCLLYQQLIPLGEQGACIPQSTQSSCNNDAVWTSDLTSMKPHGKTITINHKYVHYLAFSDIPVSGVYTYLSSST